MRLRFVVVEKLAKVHGAFLALPVVSAIFISPHGDGRRGIVFGGCCLSVCLLAVLAENDYGCHLETFSVVAGSRH